MDGVELGRKEAPEESCREARKGLRVRGGWGEGASWGECRAKEDGASGRLCKRVCSGAGVPRS